MFVTYKNVDLSDAERQHGTFSWLALWKKSDRLKKIFCQNLLHFQNWFVIISLVGYEVPTKWGISTVGSALHSHCRGQEFESPMLHQDPSEKTDFFIVKPLFAFNRNELLFPLETKKTDNVLQWKPKTQRWYPASGYTPPAA